MTVQPVTQQPLNQCLVLSILMPSDGSMPVAGIGEQNAKSPSTQDDNAPSTEQPDELKTPEEVLQSNKNLWNEAGVERLANELVQYTYFGDTVLAESTLPKRKISIT